MSLLETKSHPKSNKNISFTHSSINNKFLQKKLFRVRTEENKELSKIYITYGYWSKSEHIKFIEALYLYDCDWLKMQNYLKKRTYNQIHSHVQKFYLKLKTFKDEELGLNFTNPNVKSLKDIIKIIKEKESISNSNEKLLYIISEKLSFGKTTSGLEDEVVIEIKQKEQKNNLENINNNINNIDIINNTNKIYNLNKINFGDISKDICLNNLNNEQVINYFKYFNLSISINDSEEDLYNISIIKNSCLDDLIFLKKNSIY